MLSGFGVGALEAWETPLSILEVGEWYEGRGCEQVASCPSVKPWMLKIDAQGFRDQALTQFSGIQALRH